MNCEVCGCEMDDGVDSRQEWTTYYYSCPQCGVAYERHIVYKTQSSIVKSDNVEMVVKPTIEPWASEYKGE